MMKKSCSFFSGWVTALRFYHFHVWRWWEEESPWINNRKAFHFSSISACFVPPFSTCAKKIIRDIYYMPQRVALIKAQQYQLCKFKTKLFPSHRSEYHHMPWQLSIVCCNTLEISNLFWIGVLVRLGTYSSLLILPHILLHKGMSACRSQAFVGTYFGDVVHLILLFCVSWFIALLSSWFNNSWEMGLSSVGMNVSHMVWRFAVLRSTSLREPLGVN